MVDMEGSRGGVGVEQGRWVPAWIEVPQHLQVPTYKSSGAQEKRVERAEEHDVSEPMALGI
jgi:hypothetical protein